MGRKERRTEAEDKDNSSLKDTNLKLYSPYYNCKQISININIIVKMKIASIIHASLIVHTVLNHIARNATAWLNINYKYKVINTNSKTFHHPQSYYHPSYFLNPVATTRSSTT